MKKIIKLHTMLMTKNARATKNKIWGNLSHLARLLSCLRTEIIKIKKLMTKTRSKADKRTCQVGLSLTISKISSTTIVANKRRVPIVTKKIELDLNTLCAWEERVVTAYPAENPPNNNDDTNPRIADVLILPFFFFDGFFFICFCFFSTDKIFQKSVFDVLC